MFAAGEKHFSGPRLSSSGIRMRTPEESDDRSSESRGSYIPRMFHIFDNTNLRETQTDGDQNQ